jgi:hypothetical protein
MSKSTVSFELAEVVLNNATSERPAVLIIRKSEAGDES